MPQEQVPSKRETLLSTPDAAEADTLGGIPTEKYTLEPVGEGKEGRPQNTRTSVHGLEEIRGRYASCKGHSVDASTWLPSSKETESVEATGDNEPRRLERFEDQQGGDTHFPVDYTKPLNAFGASLDTDQQWKEHGYWRLGGDIEDSKSIQEPGWRPAPRDSRVLMYKGGGGANLEVDVPARGFGRRLFADASHLGGTESFLGIEAMFMTVFSALWLGFVCVWTFLVLSISISALDPMGPLMVLFSAPFWIIGFFLVRLTIRSSFTHEKLTISPAGFRIERTVQFGRRNRDSVAKAARAESPLTLIDRIFCKQLKGAAIDLLAATATTRHVTDRNGQTRKYFVLLEGESEHRLHTPLSDKERDWLVSEVNRTLHCIKGSDTLV